MPLVTVGKLASSWQEGEKRAQEQDEGDAQHKASPLTRVGILGKGWIGSVGAGAELTRVGILGERMDRPRRGGGGVAWSGDACVALARGRRRSRDEDEGDASVPTSHPHRSRPYGDEVASEAT